MPKDEVTDKLLKQKRKIDALESTLTCLKNVENIDNLQKYLKAIRECSNKQFKALYKQNKLEKC